jgi:hypothetical protein
MSIPRPKSRPPRYKNLRALISAVAEGAMPEAEVEQVLQAVEQGIGLSKRDKALGEQLESTGDEKDNPVWWNGFRVGLAEGYEGARLELEAGNALRPIADIAAEAQAEAQSGGKPS